MPKQKKRSKKTAVAHPYMCCDEAAQLVAKAWLANTGWHEGTMPGDIQITGSHEGADGQMWVTLRIAVSQLDIEYAQDGTQADVKKFRDSES